MSEPVIRRSESADELAEQVAATLIGVLRRVQDAGRVPSVVLTGGSIAVRIHEAVAASPDQHLIDWSRVEFWFGDERFLPADSPDRNVVQAAAVMLDRLPVDPVRVHAMAASDGAYGDDVDRAARAYAEELRRAAGGQAETPTFDVLMLGIGPDAHVASLFPEHPALSDDRPVAGVRNSPKPPPTRITMTMRSLRRAREVWFVAAGDEKAEAVRQALAGADVPAAGPKGTERTLWHLDREAASRLPPDPEPAPAH